MAVLEMAIARVPTLTPELRQGCVLWPGESAKPAMSLSLSETQIGFGGICGSVRSQIWGARAELHVKDPKLLRGTSKPLREGPEGRGGAESRLQLCLRN